MRVIQIDDKELDDDTLARIVDAVGFPLCHPTGEDEIEREIKRRETLSALRFEILGAVAYYRRDVEFQLQTQARSKVLSWADVRDPKRKSITALPENARAKDLAKSRGKTAPDEFTETSPHDPLPDNTSPFELFAVRLAPVFERFFQRPAGTSTSLKTGEVSGPFVRFVLAVSQEMNVRVQGNKFPKASTVKAALRKVPEPYRLG